MSHGGALLKRPDALRRRVAMLPKKGLQRNLDPGANSHLAFFMPEE